MAMKTGLIIGRFQPFHKGHWYLFKKALKMCDQLIIGIGSSNVKDDDNPFNLKKRQEMLELVFKKEKIQPKIKKVIAIEDVHDDTKWLSQTLKKAGEVDIVIGNNEWVSSIFKNTAIPVLKIPYYKRDVYEGKKIRHRMRLGQKWKHTVPMYLVSMIERKIT